MKSLFAWIAALMITTMVGAQAHAGLLKQAIKHPAITGSVIVVGAAALSKTSKPRCAASVDGISDGGLCQFDQEGAPPKISIKDKAALLLQKSQTK